MISLHNSIMRRIQKRIYYWVAPDGVYGLPFCNLVSLIYS